MKIWFGNRLGIIGMLVAAAFVTVATFVPFMPLNLSASALNLALAVAVARAYAPEAWAAIRNPIPNKADYLALGIFLSQAVIAGQRVNAILYRLTGNEHLFGQNDLISFLATASTMASALHLVAPHVVQDMTAKGSRISLYTALLAGVALAAFLIGWSMGKG